MRNLAGFSAIIALLFVIKCFHYLCVELILNVIYVLLIDLNKFVIVHQAIEILGTVLSIMGSHVQLFKDYLLTIWPQQKY